MTFGFGMPGSQALYDSTGWYAVNPSAVVQNQPDPTIGIIGKDKTNPAVIDLGPTKALIKANNSSLLKEGVGIGFYYGPDGGGAAYAPINPATPRTLVSIDNLPVSFPPSFHPPTPHDPAVPTVVNGDFESGLNQSLLTYLAYLGASNTTPNGRFPISYQLPGWSFQGGSGFVFNVGPAIAKVLGASKIDLTGLFALQIDPATIFSTLFLGRAQVWADNLTKTIISQGKINSFLQKNGLNAPTDPAMKAIYDATGILINSVVNVITQAVGNNVLGVSALGDTINNVLHVDPGLPNATNIYNSLNQYLNIIIMNLFKYVQGNSNSALLMGAPLAVGDVFSAFTKSLGTLLNAATLGGAQSQVDALTQATSGIFKDIVNGTLDFSTVTHNRLLIPPTNANYLSFDLFLPLITNAATQMTVTITLDDNGTPSTNPSNIITATFPVDPGFMEKRTYSVPIANPSAFAGHMAIISFTQSGVADNKLINFAPDFTPISVTNDLASSISSLYFLDNIRFSQNQDGRVPQVGVVTADSTLGITATGITLDDVSRLAEEAKANWIASGLVANAADLLAKVQVHVGLLSDGDIGDYSDGVISIDQTAAGAGWYLGGDNSEYVAGPNGTMTAVAGSDADKHFDLLTVLEHEYGHALGLPDIPDGVVPGALMSQSLVEGVRVMPSAADLTTPPPAPVAPVAPVVTRAMVEHATAAATASSATTFQSASASVSSALPLAGPLQNGTFTVTDPAAPGFGWTQSGTVTFAPDLATLAEDRTSLSSLAQTFTLNPAQTSLSFTIFGGALFQDPGRAPDSFEVALRDQASGKSVLGSTGLTLTDDLLNVQADGTVFLAPGVTVSGLTPGGKLDLSVSHVVTVDVSSVARALNLSLDFTLVTFGTHAAAVSVGDIVGANAAGPVAVADSVSVDQGVPVLVDVLANDGGVTLTIDSITQPAHGTAVIQSGKVQYTSDPAYLGADAFTYVTKDGSGQTATGNVAVTVTRPVIAPAAAPDTATVAEFGSVLIDVLGNDTGTGVTLTSVATPAHGTAVIESGKVRYTPATGYFGPDSFGYTITGQTLLTANGSVDVTITSVPGPSVTADTASLNQGTSVLIDVLANDTGLSLVLDSIVQPAHGTAAIESGQVRYTPDPAFSGSDALSYTTKDSNGQTATAGITVSVVPVIPPVAAADTATVPEFGSVLIDVLANDSGTGATLTAVGTPTNGTAVIESGKIRYTPANLFFGSDSFSYTLTGLTSLTTAGSVNVTVTQVPGPSVTADTASLNQGTSVLIDVLANDTGLSLTLDSIVQPSHGVAVIESGKIRYTSDPAFFGSDALSYTTKDTNGQTATAGVAVTVAQVIPPAPVADAAVVPEFGSVLIDVLANDAGTGVTLTGVSAPTNGTAVIESGKVRYTPANLFFGTDTFAYTVTGLTGLTAPGSVTVTITAVPGPSVTPDTASLNQGTSVLIDVLVNDTGLSLTLDSIVQPSHGVAVIESGKIRYTPDPAFSGADALNYTAKDTNGQTATAGVAVTVALVVPPTPVADTVSVAENASVLIDVLGNDTGTGLTLTGLASSGPGAPSHGTTVIESGKIRYTPTPGYNGPESFSYTVTGVTGLTAAGSVGVTVVPTPPVASADNAATDQGVSVLIDVLANDVGTGLTLQSVTAPAHGTAVIENGQVRYTADPSYSGADALTYTTKDSANQTATAGVAITIRPAPPPAPVADSATVAEDGSVLIDVLGNDAGTGLVLSGVDAPAHGTAVIENNKVRYTPVEGFTGTEAFAYTVTGLGGRTGTGGINVTVTSAAGVQSPVATADAAAVAPGASVLIDVLSNDVGSGLLLTATGTPSHGTAVIENGLVRYTPVSGFTGDDAFTYTVTGPTGLVATGSVGVTVNASAAGSTPGSTPTRSTPTGSTPTGSTPTGSTPGTGSAFADVHMITFSGQRYDFQALGDFVLARSTGADDSFQVQIHTTPFRWIANTSIVTEVAARIGDDTFSFDMRGIAGINGTVAPFGGAGSIRSLAGGSIVALSPMSYEITWSTGEVLDISSTGEYIDLAVRLGPHDGPGSVEGLMGSASGRERDFQLADKSVLAQPSEAEILSVFADSWRVGAGQSILPRNVLAGLADRLDVGPDGVGALAVSYVAPSTAAGTDNSAASSHGAGATGGLAAMRAGGPVATAYSSSGRHGVTTTVSARVESSTAPADVRGAPESTPVAAQDTGYRIDGTAGDLTGTAASGSGDITPAPAVPADTDDAPGGVISLGPDAGAARVVSAGPDIAPASEITAELTGVVSGTIRRDVHGDGWWLIGASALLSGQTRRLMLPGKTRGTRRRPAGENGEGTPDDDFLPAFDGHDGTAGDGAGHGGTGFDEAARAGSIDDGAGRDGASHHGSGLDRAAHEGAGRLAIPSFSRGPGEQLSVPATGLPVTFSSDGTATEVVFTATFDPAVLAISGASAGTGLPGGSSVRFATTGEADGRTRATISVTAPAPIVSGTVQLVRLAATVPSAAAYGTTELLELHVLSVNGVAQALPRTAGLQVVGYFGQANGGGTSDGGDAAKILRVVGGADSGFAFWRGDAPIAGGDADTNGSPDAASVETAAVPAIPGGITLTTTSSAPFVSAPESLAAKPGGMVAIPVTLDPAMVASGGTIDLRFDPAALSLTAVRADPGSRLTVNAGAVANGAVSVTIGAGPAGAASVLALFDFTVAGSVRVGSDLSVAIGGVARNVETPASGRGADGTRGRIAAGAVGGSTGMIDFGTGRNGSPAGPSAMEVSAIDDAGVYDPESAAGGNPTRAARIRLLGGRAA